jgi:acetate kinase
MPVLAVNRGSSSIKFAVYDRENDRDMPEALDWRWTA